jgi:Asp-tRNA(Asn)/Glu-tRNA(Gln) amidotransferase C subunit
MAALSKADVKALAKTVGLQIDETELTEVFYYLDAILEAMEAIDESGLEQVEPVPILPTMVRT